MRTNSEGVFGERLGQLVQLATVPAVRSHALRIPLFAATRLHFYAQHSVPAPFVGHMGAALLPALAQPETVSTLFVDPVAMGLQQQPAREFGHALARAHRRCRGLSGGRGPRVRHLLAYANLSIADVAHPSCFVDRSRFSRTSARSVGSSPGAWRRQA